MSQPSSDQEDPTQEIAAISACLVSMPAQNANAGRVPIPAPARNPWAAELYSLGLRVRPELATKRVKVDESQAKMGAHAPASFVDVEKPVTVDDAKRMLADINPQLAAEVEAVEYDPNAKMSLLERQKRLIAQYRVEAEQALRDAGDGS